MHKQLLITAVLIFLIPFQETLGAGYCDTVTHKTSKNYGKARTYVEQSLNKFSNQAVVAKKADTLLSELIQRKSLFLHNWIAKRGLYKKREVLLAKEWRRFFAETLLSAYPTKDAAVDEQIRSLVGDISQQLFTKELRVKYEKLFLEAKAAAVATIERWNPEAKLKIIERIQSIELFWLEKFSDSTEPKSALELLAWGIAYDPIPN